ncbi:MAG: methyltransferase domain-containing protein [Caldilineaceae bacterium]
MSALLKSVFLTLPDGFRKRLWIWQQQGLFRWPMVGHVKPESLWRVRPISCVYGADRGLPVDRYYIERFLATESHLIRGHVLEIADDSYTRRFGGTKVVRSDVLHVEAGHHNVTVVADLAHGENLPSAQFDCILCTQTLPFIFDLGAAMQTLYRILKPGGALLLTLPGISKISRYDVERWGHYWSFTTLSAQRLLSDVFNAEAVTVNAFGNVLTSIAFLHGLASEELSPMELEFHDPDYELIITAKGLKAA